MAVRVFAALLLACALAIAAPINLRKLHGHNARERFDESARVRGPPAQWFTQTLDHYDAENEATYQQRYFVNTSLWRAPDGPVFIYIQGEGSFDSGDVVVGQHMELAAEYGAMVFGLEHRYYGASVPVPDFTTPNMRWLSSQQALADIATFREAMTVQYNLTERNLWVAFGGSYAGALTAWVRIKYPHLIHASISSSGPVHAILDFQKYNEVVARSLATTLVGGSPQCSAAVSQAFESVKELLQTDEGRKSLSVQFNTCTSLVGASDLDVTVFWGDLSGIFQGTVQYNDEIPGSLNISSMCTYMLTPGFTPIENLATLNNVSQFGACQDISYADQITQLNNTVVDKGQIGVGLRQWTYQTCAQFGYFQTCDAGTSCPFAPPNQPTSFSTDMCVQLFGIPSDITKRRIEFSLDDYGSNHPAGTQIMYVNGLIDPWHALSVLKTLGPEQPAVVIPGTAHCANMQSSSPDDPPALKAARLVIASQLGVWLSGK